jgi:hypothetical protein
MELLLLEQACLERILFSSRKWEFLQQKLPQEVPLRQQHHLQEVYSPQLLRLHHRFLHHRPAAVVCSEAVEHPHRRHRHSEAAAASSGM